MLRSSLRWKSRGFLVHTSCSSVFPPVVVLCVFPVFLLVIFPVLAVFLNLPLALYLCTHTLRPVAMDPSHQPIQYHLARALMHLNQLASFIPSFEYPGDGLQPRHSTPPWPKLGSSPPHLHPFANGPMQVHQHPWHPMVAFHLTLS